MNTAIGFLIGIAGLLCAVCSPAQASSDAGIDVPFEQKRVLVLYSVAVDFEGGEACIRDPSCLLFDVIALLQASGADTAGRREVILFELYQSSLKPGTYLQAVRNPYEEGTYRELFDGPADRDLARQTISLLARTLGLPGGGRSMPDRVRLYKCTSPECNDVRFGSFPSEEERTGYCAMPGTGCDPRPVSVPRREMSTYVSPIPE